MRTISRGISIFATGLVGGGIGVITDNIIGSVLIAAGIGILTGYIVEGIETIYNNIETIYNKVNKYTD